VIRINLSGSPEQLERVKVFTVVCQRFIIIYDNEYKICCNSSDLAWFYCTSPWKYNAVDLYDTPPSHTILSPVNGES